MPKDLLQIDFGITYLRLNTDTQEFAYVLKPGETEVPAYLKEAFKAGNRVQDLLTQNFVASRKGNQILREARKMMDAEGSEEVFTRILWDSTDILQVLP